jgi:hypothetical protein
MSINYGVTLVKAQRFNHNNGAVFRQGAWLKFKLKYTSLSSYF